MTAPGPGSSPGGAAAAGRSALAIASTAIVSSPRQEQYIQCIQFTYVQIISSFCFIIFLLSSLSDDKESMKVKNLIFPMENKEMEAAVRRKY